MIKVLVIAGHHEGEFFQVSGNWPLWMAYRIPIRLEWPISWEPEAGPMQPIEIECVDYYIYQIRHAGTDRLWYVAMPVGDQRDPAIVAMDSMFYNAGVKV